jgi:hypothetical protein
MAIRGSRGRSVHTSVTSNARAHADAWKKREAAFRKYIQLATVDATNLLHVESKKLMTELIYDKPVPTKGEVSRERGVVTAKGRGKSANAVVGTWITTKTGKKICIPLSDKQAKRKAWKRTGNLRRSERKRNVNPYEGQVYNDANYAKIRHDKKRTRYPAPWRMQAIKVCKVRIRKIYRGAVVRAMAAGAISDAGGSN